MKVLVLGGEGMLGHRLVKNLNPKQFSVWSTIRNPKTNYLNSKNLYTNVDVLNIEKIIQIIDELKPDAVINCIGVIKQRDIAKTSPIMTIKINSLLPHQLAEICYKHKTRLIHLSTDCVFSGQKGMYQQDDIADPIDLYGKSKLLGELGQFIPRTLTIRSSIIGLELKHKKSLIEWFLSQKGQVVQGFTQVFYSGVTTTEMCRILSYILIKCPDLEGIWQVASKRINKCDLLIRLEAQLDFNIKIKSNTNTSLDRSLDGSKFEEKTGYHVSAWSHMLKELAQEIKERDKIC